MNAEHLCIIESYNIITPSVYWVDIMFKFVYGDKYWTYWARSVNKSFCFAIDPLFSCHGGFMGHLYIGDRHATQSVRKRMSGLIQKLSSAPHLTQPPCLPLQTVSKYNSQYHKLFQNIPKEEILMKGTVWGFTISDVCFSLRGSCWFSYKHTRRGICFNVQHSVE